MKLNFVWKEKTAQYQNGEELYLNKICVGDYTWNSMRSKSESSENNDWVGSSNLPQMNRRVYGKDTNEIKPKIEKQVMIWFTEALKDAKELPQIIEVK